MGSISKNYNKIPRLVSKNVYIFRFGVPGEKLFQNTPRLSEMRGILTLFFYIDPEQLLKTGFLHDFDGKKGLLGEFFDIDPIMSLYAEHQFENVADDYIACNIVKAVSLKI